MPIIPNFNGSSGRLTTDRFDFQDHVDGYNFRHHADQIDLFPTLVIDGYTKTNVQSALTLLSTLILPPVIADATTSSKGIIQLAGDFATSSTAAIPVVGGIQGRPISTLAPSAGDVLTYTAGVWGPSPATNAFIANGDLAGTSVLQTVIGLTGTAGTVSAACTTINFLNSISTPTIMQATTTSAAGTNLHLLAQTTSFAAANGGNIILSGGGTASGLKGGVKLQVNTDNVLQITEVASGRRVLSLFKTTDLNTSDMPALSGDMVMYIRDAAAAPSLGSSPTNGTVLYSSAGQLHVMESSGATFTIGSIPNPSTWGILAVATGQTISYRENALTTAAAPQTFSYALTDNASTRIDVLMVGKEVGSNQSAQFNLSMGYTRDGGGAPAAIGTVTSADARATAPGATGWTIPDITLSVNNVIVNTGYNAATNIYWTAVVQLTICKSS